MPLPKNYAANCSPLPLPKLILWPTLSSPKTPLDEQPHVYQLKLNQGSLKGQFALGQEVNERAPASATSRNRAHSLASIQVVAGYADATDTTKSVLCKYKPISITFTQSMHIGLFYIAKAQNY